MAALDMMLFQMITSLTMDMVMGMDPHVLTGMQIKHGALMLIQTQLRNGVKLIMSGATLILYAMAH